MATAYFLVWRREQGTEKDWSNPLGGLVLEAEEFNGYVVPDWPLVHDMFADRFECRSDETLEIFHVHGPDMEYLAQSMHEFYEETTQEFVDFMTTMEV